MKTLLGQLGSPELASHKATTQPREDLVDEDLVDGDK
jgi:hypothetical protein